MRKVDMFWKSNSDWWEFRNCIPVVKDDAPPEAKKSYERYLEQTTREPIRMLDCDWEEAFLPHILARGKQYYEEGRVSAIMRYGNRVVAHVTGSEDYCVEIDLPGGVPGSWLCTCPYAVKGNCKHKAALLYAVEAEEYTFTGEPPELEEVDIPVEELQIPWCEAIENLPADTLREILARYAMRDSEIGETLAIHYLGRLPEGLLSKWKTDLLSYAKEMAAGRSHVAKDDELYFINGMRFALRERFLLLRKVGAVMDAFYYLGTVFEIASKWVHDDPDCEFFDFYYECMENWDLLFSEATEHQREQMHTWFWDHRAAFFAHSHDACDVDFIYHPWSVELERKSLEVIDSLLKQCNDSKEVDLLVECRINIMEFLDCTLEEQRAFLYAQLEHDYVRNRLLEAFDENPEDYPLMVDLLSQLKMMDEDDFPRLIKDAVWLAALYKKEGESTAYEAERTLLLTEFRKRLELEMVHVHNQNAARRFAACLDTLRSLNDKVIDQMIEELVDQLCSNPSVARKGIVEIMNQAGFVWPKPCDWNCACIHVPIQGGN